jgi:hypothetical protein
VSIAGGSDTPETLNKTFYTQKVSRFIEKKEKLKFLKLNVVGTLLAFPFYQEIDLG